MPKKQAKLKLIYNIEQKSSIKASVNQEEQALFWLTSSAELLTKDFNNIDSAIDALISQVLKRFNDLDPLALTEFHGFLRLIIETDEELKSSLMQLLLPRS